jgi:hypothetical protein
MATGKGTSKMAGLRRRQKGHDDFITLDRNGGIPVRELLQSMFKIQRDKALGEAFVYFCYVALFLLIIMMINDVHVAQTTNEALIDLFLDEEFPDVVQYKKNFEEIMTLDELWTWIEGPLYKGLYPEDLYDGQPLKQSELQYILMYNRLVGQVQLRQMRVTDNSCAQRRFSDVTSEVVVNLDPIQYADRPRFDTIDGHCYAEFTPGDEAKEPYGPNGTWVWTDGHTTLEGLYNYGPNYGTGGYVTYLPRNDSAAAWETLQYLKENRWTDQGTRAVVVNFNLYNTQTKMVSTVRLIVEQFMTGFVVKTFKFYTYKFVVYESQTDMLRAMLEAIFVLFWVYYVQKEIRNMIVFKPWYAYFFRLENVFEVSQLVMVVSVFGYWAVFVLHPIKEKFSVSSEEYLDMFAYATLYIQAFSVAGFVALLLCLKAFKYMAISKKMNALWLTLMRAAPDLVAFAIGFAVMAGGFAFMAMMLFGFALPEFRNLTVSFSTLLRFPLGDFDYKDLSRARPALAGMFFSLYIGSAAVARARRETWSTNPMQSAAGAGGARKESTTVVLPDGSAGATTAAELEASQWLAWSKERAFYKDLRLLMRYARRNKNVQLYDYVDKVFMENPEKNMYIGVHELCALSSKEGDTCPIGEHKTCQAAKVVHAYSEIKEVTILGISKQHTSYASRAEVGLKKWRVSKVNRQGLKQPRILCIDLPNGHIMNFSVRMRLRKLLPIRQLIQVEVSRINERKLTLVFTSQGVKEADMVGNFNPDALETTYNLFFKNKPTRDAFSSSILRANRICAEADRRGKTPAFIEAEEIKKEAQEKAKAQRLKDRKISTVGAARRKSVLSSIVSMAKKVETGKALPPPAPVGRGAGSPTAASSTELQRVLRELQQQRELTQSLAAKVEQLLAR